MDHETIQDLFSEYMEGELSAEKARQVEEHLEGCDECREMYELCKDSVDSLRSLSKIDPPGDLEQKIKKRIRARSRGKFFSASSHEHVVHRVPFEIISLILILIAMALFYMLTLIAGVEAPEEPPENGQDSEKPEPREPESAPIDATRARELADPVARAEISRVEAEHKKNNPAVRLDWKDYEVTVTGKPEHFVVFYEYSNPDPGFELWAGHGMHFNVYVDTQTGEVRMVGGE
jgi:hypothetical protein